MEYIRGLEQYCCDGRSAVTFGKFDGLHIGHQKLITKVQELSRETRVRSIVCAFDMHPLWKAKQVQPQILMDAKERYEHLKDETDVLIECPFTPQFSQVEAEEFIERIICGLLHAKYVVVGTDFQFGREKRGDVRMLAEYAGRCGYELFVIEKERYQDRIISSTFIKEVLRQGDVCLAETLLGYPYTLKGRVEHGRRLGRTLGFPTVNVAWPDEKTSPPNGVYFSRIRIDGKSYYAISNVGVKPTVSEAERKLIESFLLDFDEDVYGKEIQIELLHFRRPEQKFEDVAGLKEAVDQDLLAGKEFFANW